MSVRTAITSVERSNLSECEAVIERGLANFIEVGNALMKIRDGRLYRAEFKTFEDYCIGKWAMSRAYAHRTIEASQTVSNLLPIGNIPKSESVTRPLTKLPPVTQREVWKEAVETAPAGKVTAKHVAEIVRTLDPEIERKAQARAEEAEKDSEKLWALKSAWRSAGQRDRKLFLAWASTN